MTKLQELHERLLADMEAEVEEDDLFAVPGYAQARKDDWVPTAKQLEIMAILKETPMLTDWTLRQLRSLQARVRYATLREMYSLAEIKSLADSLANSDEERARIYANFGLAADV